MTTRTRTKGNAKAGDVVEYSDMANPGSRYTVIGPVTHVIGAEDNPYRFSFSEYILEDEDGNRTTSDCRQHGWVTITEEA